MDSRPPPPSGAPPSYAFVTKMYKKSLRPVVMLVTFLGGAWAFFSAIGFFRSSGPLRSANAPFLVTTCIVLGVIYIVIMLIENLGFLAASMRRLILVRLYAYLSVVATALVLAAGLFRTIIHFTRKNDIINACSTFTEGEVVFFGFWGPVSRDNLDREEAAEWCERSWGRESWAEIVSLLFTLVLAGLFTSVAFAYYRQVLDPSSVANARPPVRVDMYPSHYNPAYGSNAGYGYNNQYPAGPYHQPYAPPPGPPPPRDDDGNPPGYTGGDAARGYGFQDQKNPAEGPARPAP